MARSRIALPGAWQRRYLVDWTAQSSGAIPYTPAPLVGPTVQWVGNSNPATYSVVAGSGAKIAVPANDTGNIISSPAGVGTIYVPLESVVPEWRQGAEYRIVVRVVANPSSDFQFSWANVFWFGASNPQAQAFVGFGNSSGQGGQVLNSGIAVNAMANQLNGSPLPLAYGSLGDKYDVAEVRFRPGMEFGGSYYVGKFVDTVQFGQNNKYLGTFDAPATLSFGNTRFSRNPGISANGLFVGFSAQTAANPCPAFAPFFTHAAVDERMVS